MGEPPTPTPNYISILPVVALCPLLVFLLFHSLHCLGFTLSMSSHHIWFFENSWPLLFFLSLFNPSRGHRPEASWLILTKMCFKDVGIQSRVVCSLCTNSSPQLVETWRGLYDKRWNHREGQAMREMRSPSTWRNENIHGLVRFISQVLETWIILLKKSNYSSNQGQSIIHRDVTRA